jgi:excisionase family DNA binding protein
MAMLQKYPDVMDVKQVMAALNVSRHSVYDLISRGDLPSFRIGKTHKIAKKSLIKYINKAK